MVTTWMLSRGEASTGISWVIGGLASPSIEIPRYVSVNRATLVSPSNNSAMNVSESEISPVEEAESLYLSSTREEDSNAMVIAAGSHEYKGNQMVYVLTRSE